MYMLHIYDHLHHAYNSKEAPVAEISIHIDDNHIRKSNNGLFHIHNNQITHFQA